MQAWRRSGLIFSDVGGRGWTRTHAACPIACPLELGLFRLYFATRDERQRAHIGTAQMSIDPRPTTGPLETEPVLAPGSLGAFDDHGVIPASLVEYDGRLLLYYSGWNPGIEPPLFYSSIGLAVSDDGGLSFTRFSRAPIMARSEWDPCLVAAPSVLKEGSSWRMWYVSGFRWDRGEDGRLRSWYHIKHAISDDGIAWRRDGTVCIDQQHPGERNIGRCCVLREGDRYEMWYCWAGDHVYRLGYADSSDGLSWTRRDDELQLVGGPDDEWDSQERAYPWVFHHGRRRYMLYNGNGHGRDGIGLAIEQPATTAV
jgi:hypothetical protein